jgi:hypothetical protein
MFYVQVHRLEVSCGCRGQEKRRFNVFLMDLSKETC